MDYLFELSVNITLVESYHNCQKLKETILNVFYHSKDLIKFWTEYLDNIVIEKDDLRGIENSD